MIFVAKTTANSKKFFIKQPLRVRNMRAFYVRVLRANCNHACAHDAPQAKKKMQVFADKVTIHIAQVK